MKWFNAQEGGFGFIVQDGGGPDAFVHLSTVERAGLRGLNGPRQMFASPGNQVLPLHKGRLICRLRSAKRPPSAYIL